MTGLLTQQFGTKPMTISNGCENMPIPDLVNLSCGKQCTQSSISQWSVGTSKSSDAAQAVNGDIKSDRVFHTAREHKPWWQVDLGEPYEIVAIFIYNRQNCAFRLKNFSILISFDDHRWLTVFEKHDTRIFGEIDNLPFEIQFADKLFARFVRVRLDAFDHLHFKECQVYGRAVEQAKTREIELLFNKQIAESTYEPSTAIHAGRIGFKSIICGFTIFVDSKYDPTIQHAIREGSYELREIQVISDLVKRTDKVLEVGSAIGVVSMVIASIVGESNMVSFDANPDIVADANKNIAYNGFVSLKTRNGILVNQNRMMGSNTKTMEFGISESYWSSRIIGLNDKNDDIQRVVDVPVFCFENEIKHADATAIVCDIEGGEVDLFINADLTGISLIIVETHYWSVGRRRTDEMVRHLIKQGFDLNLDKSGNHILAFERDR
jgi:FkbM family methyltransferase